MITERKMQLVRRGKKQRRIRGEKKTCFYHSHLFWSESGLLFKSTAKEMEDDVEDTGRVEVTGDWVRE